MSGGWFPGLDEEAAQLARQAVAFVAGARYGCASILPHQLHMAHAQPLCDFVKRRDGRVPPALFELVDILLADAGAFVLRQAQDDRRAI